jgi:hypothetical protein
MPLFLPLTFVVSLPLNFSVHLAKTHSEAAILAAFKYFDPDGSG